ncbi:hypothetical protein ACFY72_20800 [Streptomyces globisporus]
MALFGPLCALAAVLALLGLAYTALDAVPRITGTVAAIVTLAAFGAAILR